MLLDFYELLGVDRAADRAQIESALNQRQPEWSAQTRRPGEGSRYLTYLEQIPALRSALLSTPEARAAYDEQLGKTLQRHRHQILDELQRLVRLRGSKGGLTVSDRQFLRAEAERAGLARDDLERMLQSFPPLPEAPEEDAVWAEGEAIDRVEARQIRAVLQALDRRDLYHLLDLPRDVPDAEIALRVNELRRQGTLRGGVSEENALWLNAIALV